ncbi:MAG TPA: hypothetical protein VHM90_18215 [Phycisphaerae bacterium]|jgi:hypothetical protein|nr:hypothetical protein [Phycisphaerae bacterium]
MRFTPSRAAASLSLAVLLAATPAFADISFWSVVAVLDHEGAGLGADLDFSGKVDAGDINLVLGMLGAVLSPIILPPTFSLTEK